LRVLQEQRDLHTEKIAASDGLEELYRSQGALRVLAVLQESLAQVPDLPQSGAPS
jgi:hypothetical protein